MAKYLSPTLCNCLALFSSIFKRDKIRFTTDAERMNYSYVFFRDVGRGLTRMENNTLKEEPWWFPIEGAIWKKV